MRFPFFALLFIALTLGSTAHATSTDSGSWTFAGTAADEQAMAASVVKATSELNFAVRNYARKRLRDVCEPWKTLRIERSGDEVAITVDGETLASRLGATVQKDSSEGDITVRREIRNGTLVETMSMKRGARINEYHVVGNRVRVDSRIESSKLTAPIRFSYTYR